MKICPLKLSYILRLEDRSRRVELGLDELLKDCEFLHRERGDAPVGVSPNEARGLTQILEDNLSTIAFWGMDDILCDLRRYLKKCPWRDIDEP